MRWHVLFDAQPEVMAHVCEAHRQVVLSIPCWHCDADVEDCPHVHHVACTCGEWPDCDLCVDARVVA